MAAFQLLLTNNLSVPHQGHQDEHKILHYFENRCRKNQVIQIFHFSSLACCYRIPKTVIPSARDRFSLPDLSGREIYKFNKNIDSSAQAPQKLVPLRRNDNFYTILISCHFF